MIIGIDARMLGAGFGLARYVQQLVLQLEKIDSQNQYVLFLRKENWDEYEPANPNFKKVLADIPWYGLAEQLILPGIIKKEKVDVMHFPHWNVPFLYRGLFVVTIHDLIMYHFPRPEATTKSKIVFWAKDKLHRVVIKNAVKRAKKIIVTSEFTKKDVHETLGVPMERMTVTYQAPYDEISKSKCQISNQYQNPNDQNVLNKYNIAKPYILYVGAAYPHKNLERLLEAWKIFTQKYGPDYQLVLVGKENYFYRKLADSETMKQLGNAKYVGFVPDDDLSALYASASLYIFPSLYEGFGLPPLEAMVHNVPIVSSDRTCLPEVLQDAAYYFNPEIPEEITEGIHSVLTDQPTRDRLIANGQKLCPVYSWPKLAEATKRIYESEKL